MTRTADESVMKPKAVLPSKPSARQQHQIRKIGTRRWQKPITVRENESLWSYALSIVSVHLVALLAVIPWLFSWTGVVTAVAGLYVFGTRGINLCYHRPLTHRSFKISKRLEHLFAMLVVWGVFIRTVAMWHITWSVNSWPHICGYRNYETGKNVRSKRSKQWQWVTRTGRRDELNSSLRLS